MIAGFTEKIGKYFTTGHERSLMAKKNITYSFLLKGLGMIASLSIIPLSIRYVDSKQFGIWLTLSSIVNWMAFFDLGLSNGLRNKLAESNALERVKLGRVYVSTTYGMIAIICVVLMGLFLGLNRLIDWGVVLQSGKDRTDFTALVTLIAGLFCIQFIMQTVNTVLLATHQAAKVSLLALVSQFGVLAGIYLISHFAAPSLTLLVLVNGIAPILVQIIASLWYYNTDLRGLAPALKYMDFRFARELIGLGGLFFIIQIGALVLFQTDNIVITQLFGPAQVTTFNIAYKLFSVFILGFNILMAPFWSAFTDAYVKKDIDWIRAVLAKMRYLWFFIVLGCIVLVTVAPYIYRIWISRSLAVPFSLSLAMAFYVVVYIWQTIHVYFLNGINKIRLQLYMVVAASLTNIPLAIFLGDRIGLAGVTWSNTILFLVMGFVFTFQTEKILNGSAKGILNR